MGEKNHQVPHGCRTHDLALGRCGNALPLVKVDWLVLSHLLGLYVYLVVQ